MFALGSQIKNLPIISLQTGQTVALLGDPVIDPDRLEIPAFTVWDGHWKRSSQVLMSQDIRRLSPEAVVVNAFEDIGEADDVVRLKPLADQRFRLEGIPVVTESGSHLGKVDDFTIDADNFAIQKLYVKQPLLKNLLMDNLVVDRSQIVDVTKRQITVRDAFVKKGLLMPAPTSPTVPE